MTERLSLSLQTGKFLASKQSFIQSKCFNSMCISKYFPLLPTPPYNKGTFQANLWPREETEVTVRQCPSSCKLSRDRISRRLEPLRIFLTPHLQAGGLWEPLSLGSLQLSGMNASVYALLHSFRASLVAPMVKISLQCRRLGFDPWVRKIPWRRKMTTHFSVLAWKIPWTEEPGRLQSMGLQRVRHDLATKQQHPCVHANM